MKSLNIIILLLLIHQIISKKKEEVIIETPIPKNGTFIFSQFQDSKCQNLSIFRGFIPDAGEWNNPLKENENFILVSYKNETGELIYKKKTSNGELNEETLKCDNSCQSKNSIYYTCHFIQAYNLSSYTFKGYSDSGCNNIDGKKFVYTLTDSCWNLEGEGSMTVVNFIDRLLIVDVFSTNNCKGTKSTKSFKCNEGCFKNPINEEKVHYTCKFENESFLKYSFGYLFLILFVI